MNVQDLNIENLSEEQFHKKVSDILQVAAQLTERGYYELGYEIAIISAAGVRLGESDKIKNSEYTFGDEDMMYSIALQSESLSDVFDMLKQQEMFNFFDEIMKDKDDEE